MEGGYSVGYESLSVGVESRMESLLLSCVSLKSAPSANESEVRSGHRSAEMKWNSYFIWLVFKTG